MFGGLWMQGQTDGSSVRNILEHSRTEEVTGAGKVIFVVGFKFVASEARKNFDSTSSSVQREEDRSASPSTQEHQKLEVKLKHRVKLSMIWPGSDRGENIGRKDQGANMEEGRA